MAGEEGDGAGCGGDFDGGVVPADAFGFLGAEVDGDQALGGKVLVGDEHGAGGDAEAGGSVSVADALAGEVVRITEDEEAGGVEVVAAGEEAVPGGEQATGGGSTGG